MRLRRDAKVELIRQAPLFAHCSARELSAIATIADEIDIPEGKVLIRAGDRGAEFFVIVDGAVAVTRNGRKLRTLGAGDFLGEIALVSRVPRTATARATTPVRALVVHERAFRELLRRSPRTQLKVLQALADRLAADAV